LFSYDTIQSMPGDRRYTDEFNTKGILPSPADFPQLNE